jgi:hypothetical protein
MGLFAHVLSLPLFAFLLIVGTPRARLVVEAAPNVLAQVVGVLADAWLRRQPQSDIVEIKVLVQAIPIHYPVSPCLFDHRA